MSAKHPDIATAIITRQFDLRDGGRVDIFIWKPDFDDQGHWTCTHLIRGLGEDRIRQDYGVDSLDVMTSALQRIGAELYYSQKYEEGDLTLFGQRDLRLPLIGREGPPKQEYEKADLLTLVGEPSILAMPGDRFPYIAWPGELLQRVILRLEQLANGSDKLSDLRRKVAGLAQYFTDYQDYYERVCEAEGFDISYVKEERRTSSNRKNC